MAQMDLQEPKVQMVLEDYMEKQDHKVLRDLRDLRGLKD
jgi:hypothetical protein